MACFAAEIVRVSNDLIYVQFLDSDCKESLARISLHKMINEYSIFPIEGMWVAILIRETDGKGQFDIQYTKPLPSRQNCIILKERGDSDEGH